nr:sulfite exporter TauE/SafE family protein [Spelaeicoccus albus]
MTDLTAPVLALLAMIGLVGGIAITALGPGGVLVTVGLFGATALSPAAVAGTAIVTHIGTGLLGTAAYARSGQLREPVTRRTACLLGGTAVIGTPAGIAANSAMSGRAFGVLLGAFVALVAVLVVYRERRSPQENSVPEHPPHGAPTLICLGLCVSAAGGMFGIGGPMLAVPLLIAIGVPVLPALASAQAQSVVIAAVGSVGYIVSGDIDWGLALLVGIPEAIGVLVGWKIAHAVPTRGLKYALVAVLFALAPYLALTA